ncbi:MAG: hypothetical protein ACREF4_02295 [Gammaproteobacteria bacterium]
MSRKGPCALVPVVYLSWTTFSIPIPELTYGQILQRNNTRALEITRDVLASRQATAPAASEDAQFGRYLTVPTTPPPQAVRTSSSASAIPGRARPRRATRSAGMFPWAFTDDRTWGCRSRHSQP